MILRTLSATLAGVSALILATSMAAAQIAAPTPPLGLPKPALAKPRPAATAVAKPKPAAPEVQVATPYPIYDSIIDPETAAIRAALATAGTVGTFLDKRDAAAVAEYYAEQGYTPSWTLDGKLTPRAQNIIAAIGKAADEGLDPTIYNLPAADLGSAVPASAADLAMADVQLSDAIVTYARHVHSGRLDPSTVSENFNYAPHLLDPLAVLTAMATTADPEATFVSYDPKHKEFAALKERLHEIRDDPVETPILVPEGGTLKLGVKDMRVVFLRARLKVTAPADDLQLYDKAVADAVKAFQTSKGLKADGAAGKGTVVALNTPPPDPVSTILVNMERWRWMPEELGPFYVRVNIPNFNLDIYRNGKIDYTTRIVVGQTDKQTPIFSDEIETAVVNPTWNVPASIAVKEMLPKLQATGGGALRGYQVFANLDGSFRPVDPTMIDWSTIDMRRVQIKQPPGDDNALGSIKFLFPNPYAVYLHDTPSKSFFQRDYRALSHGCMRVQNPWDFAAALLRDDPNVSVAQLKSLVGGRETAVNLTHHIPVNITYFTAWIDDSGTLQLRNDVYGHDKHMKQMMGLGELG
ncbi:MAG TPA: L,D-transpeptidase family protein [Bauldia sp.]|nr:L,D-transpeptidase family protein [Bauldia sp.]